MLNGQAIQNQFKRTFAQRPEARANRTLLEAFRIDAADPVLKCIRGVDVPASSGLNVKWKSLLGQNDPNYGHDTQYGKAPGGLSRVVLKIDAPNMREFKRKARELLDEMNTEFEALSVQQAEKVAAGTYTPAQDPRIQHPVYRMFMYRRTFIPYEPTGPANSTRYTAGHPVFDQRPHDPSGGGKTFHTEVDGVCPTGEWCVRGVGVKAVPNYEAGQWATDDPSLIYNTYIAQNQAMLGAKNLGGMQGDYALTSLPESQNRGAATITGGYYFRPLNCTYGGSPWTNMADENMSYEQKNDASSGNFARTTRMEEDLTANGQCKNTWSISAECNNTPRLQFRGGPQDRVRFGNITPAY